jgi:NADH:ubiquinone oxidoreductase subunit 4 (subunit M)
MVPLLIGIVWLGLYPQPVLRRMEPATKRYLQLTQPAQAAAPVAVRGSTVEVRP